MRKMIALFGTVFLLLSFVLGAKAQEEGDSVAVELSGAELTALGGIDFSQVSATTLANHFGAKHKFKETDTFNISLICNSFKSKGKGQCSIIGITLMIAKKAAAPLKVLPPQK